MSPAAETQPTRESLEAMLARVADSARSSTPRETFHARLLDELVEGLSMAGGVIWSETRLGQLEASCQIQPDAVNLTSSPDSRKFHGTLIDTLLRHPQARMLPAQGHDGTWHNPTDHVLFFQPLTCCDQTIAVLELFQPAVEDSRVAHGVLRLLSAVAEIASEHYLRERLSELEREKVQAGRRELFLERIFRPEGARAMAFVATNEARPLLAADRVSILEWRNRHCRLLAVSGVDSVERRSGSARAAEALAEAALVAGGVWYPDDDSTLAPQMESVLHRYLEETAAASVAVIPLESRASMIDEGDEDNRLELLPGPHGVLLLDWFSEVPPREIRTRVEPVARQLGLAMYRAELHDRLPFLGISRVLRDLGWQRGVSSWKKYGAAVAVLGFLVLMLGLVSAELSITARGRIEPRERVDIFAPRNGVIVELPVAHSQRVSRGEALAKLRSAELDRQMNETQGRLRTVEETLSAIRATRLQQGGTSMDPRGGGQMSAQEVELEVTRKGLQEQWELLVDQQQELRLTSPFDGQVVTWDVRELQARPVSQGEFLMRVANIEGPWMLELDVPENRVGHLLAAMAAPNNTGPLSVEYLLEASPATNYPGTVTAVADATHLGLQGLPVVLVEVDLPPENLPRQRPGATVHARIACGQYSLGFVWFHRIHEAIQMAIAYRF
jgi:multidrug efflux pump subunit AcrA (membrane-fusion protein)